MARDDEFILQLGYDAEIARADSLEEMHELIGFQIGEEADEEFDDGGGWF